MIRDFVIKVKNKEINLIDHTADAIKQLQDINQIHHCFTFIGEKEALDQAADLQKQIDEGADPGPLTGVLVAVKDGICVKGFPSESSSKVLRGYKPVFDATSIKRLKQAGAIIVAKTIQDEFGFGSFCTNVPDDRTPPNNPNDPGRVCGGSSGGAGAAAKAVNFPFISIGESTGGSITNPAAWCGVYGMCPTYGRVSRYGLIDYANSLDKIGPLTQTLSDNALALKIMEGFDVNDTTSSNHPSEPYALNKDIKGMKVGILAGLKHIDPKIQKIVDETRARLESCGVATKEISLPLTTEHALSVYYLIAMAEASTNLAKYCGMRYGAHEPINGTFDQYASEVRTRNFGQEAIRRVLVGTFARMAGYRDAYYTKAAKIRTLIIDEYNDAFRDVDVLLCPSMPIIAPKFNEVENLTLSQVYAMDQLTVGPNLAGLPNLSIPIGTIDNMPVGIALIAKHFNEQHLYNIGAALE